VAVFHPAAQAGDENLILPGTLMAYIESPIYARTNGYLKKWYRDIGSRVSKGELLAEIDTPEVDQQLSQARADLATSQANVHLSETTAVRYSDLLKSDGVSKQEVDNANGDLAAKRAIVQSAEANVRRLEELKSFQRIDAPLAASLPPQYRHWHAHQRRQWRLLAAALLPCANRSHARVRQCARSLRLFHSPGNRRLSGTHAVPRQRFEGKVVRTAEAIDLSTRTLLTEVDVPNKSAQLLPGGYARFIFWSKSRPSASRFRERAALPLRRTPRRSDRCESPRASAISHHRPRLRHQPRSA